MSHNRYDEFVRYSNEISKTINQEVNNTLLESHNDNYGNCDPFLSEKLKGVLIELLNRENLVCPSNAVSRLVYFNSINTKLKSFFDINRLHEVSMVFNPKELIDKNKRAYRLDTSDRQNFFNDIKNSTLLIKAIKTESSNLYLRKIHNSNHSSMFKPSFAILGKNNAVNGLIITMELELIINNKTSLISLEAIADYYSIDEFYGYVNRESLLLENQYLLLNQVKQKEKDLQDAYYYYPAWELIKTKVPAIVDGFDNLTKKDKNCILNLDLDVAINPILEYAHSIGEY